MGGFTALAALAAGCGLSGCLGSDAAGLAPAQPATTHVKMDFYHRPLPEMPLPNDIATRYDATSATGRRINASMVAPTAFESDVRTRIDALDGWGVYQPIAIPFEGRPLDVGSIVAAHRDPQYGFDDDVVYLINVDRKSAHFGELRPLDLGNGNYPVVLQNRSNYWKHDPRVDTLSLLFEETAEDKNGNGKLDPGEDTDADGVLDVPNYLPGMSPAPDDLAARADALMTFYEKETNTLLVRALTPLEERTTYAVVITRRLLDEAGEPVGSPYPFINHTAQTEALGALPEVLPKGLALSDIAFTYTFTTQTVKSDIVAVRDGLYGKGVQSHLATEFPDEIDTLEQMRDADAYPGSKQLHLMYGEDWLKAMPVILTQLLGQPETSVAYQKTIKSYSYVDYFVIGSFEAPQLFARRDEKGELLPYNEQSWPQDLDRVAATGHRERIYFTLAVPRKEISVRKDGQPAPVVIVGHGYGGSRFDGMQFAGYLATHGLATLSIDCPSHGLGLDEGTAALAKGVVGQFGLSAGAEAIIGKGRAFDQNNDGNVDSGADYWSAYLFHTRDMVRQSALDYMQLMRVFTTFDGERRWKHDVDGDGQKELAGDFDADGTIDAGGSANFYMMGGSLGGIMSMYMAGVEPKLTAVAPIAGGGGLGDVGIRSKQGGVPEAFILRGMGPLFAGTRDPATGVTLLEQILPDLNNAAEVPIADVPGLSPGDTMIVENLRTAERGCGYMTPQGGIRAAVAADVGDPLVIRFYKGSQIEGTECELRGSPSPIASVDTWEIGGDFQSTPVDPGTPLTSLSEGLGLRRANPEFRRFQGLGQLIIDPGDPAAYARHVLDDPLEFGTGEKTGTHSLVISSMGDMNVPVSSGVTFGRAAGLIDYLNVDPRYGKPVNQELLDDYTAEAAYNIGRYKDVNGNPVHLDVEGFSQGTDMWGTSIPRKEKPFRIGFDATDKLGGKSAAIFPYTVPEGQHGFDLPGEMTDKALKQCLAACGEPEGDDPCGCNSAAYFDVGLFMFHMMGRYMASGGTFLGDDLCMSADDCAGEPFAWEAPPAARDVSTLP